MPNVTREELEEALRGDEQNLANRREWLKIIDRGEQLPDEARHLSRANAVRGIAALQQVIKNKKTSIANMLRAEEADHAAAIGASGSAPKDRATAKEEARQVKRREHEDARTALREQIAQSEAEIMEQEVLRRAAVQRIAEEEVKIKGWEKECAKLTTKIKSLAEKG
jgi:hypothetical protein